MSIKTLRGYQWDMVRFLARKSKTHKSLGLASPTGSGKTLIVQALVIKLHRPHRAFTGVVIAAPSLTTRDGFASTRQIYAPHLVGPGTTGSGLGLWSQDRFEILEGDPSVKKDEFKQALRPGFQRKAQITTHQLIVSPAYMDALPQDLTGKLLIVDEGHHAGTGEEAANTQIGILTQEWMNRGGTVLFITATPFRTDGNTVFPEGTAVYTRSLSKHSASGYAPNNFFISTVVMNTEAHTTAQLAGDKISEYEANQGTSYDEMVLHWKAEGCPKALFLVPPGHSKKWAKRMMEAIQKKAPGTRVGNFVGEAKSVSQTLQNALVHEQSVKDYLDSKYDIIVACQRFNEGTDWPLCSHVYCYGISSSFNLILQRWGRAFRMKSPDPVTNEGGIKGHPHAETAHIIFFVPKVKAELLAEFEKQHSDHALMLACLMTDFETAREYGTHKRIRYEGAWERRGKGASGGGSQPETEDEALQRIEVEQALEVADFRRGEIRKEAVIWATQQKACGYPPSIEQFNTWMGTRGYTPNEMVILQKMTLAELVGADALEVIQQKEYDLIQQATMGPMGAALIPGQLRDFFNQEMEIYRKKTTHFQERVLRVVSSFTGEDATDIAKRLHARVQNKRIKLPYTDVELVHLIEAYQETNGGALPTRGITSDPSLAGVTLIPGTTVSDLEKHLHDRALSLGWFLWAAQNGAVDGPPLMETDLAGLSKDYRRVLAKYNMDTSKNPPGIREIRRMMAPVRDHQENVIALDMALWFGWRGLPGGTRLRNLP